jgi:hypothetical protein
MTKYETSPFHYGSIVGWGTMIQTRRSRVQFLMRSLGVLIDLILPVLGLTQPITEMSTRNRSGGKGLLVNKANTLTTTSELSTSHISHPNGLQQLITYYLHPSTNHSLSQENVCSHEFFAQRYCIMRKAIDHQSQSSPFLPKPLNIF